MAEQWVCLGCGERYDEETTPCIKCAGEELARVAADDRIDESIDVVYVCQQCGREHPRRNPPCNECGGMGFATVPKSAHQEAEQDEEPKGTTAALTGPGDSTNVTGWTIVGYLAAAWTAYLSLGSLQEGVFLAAIAFFGASVVAAPAGRTVLADEQDIRLSTGAVLLLYLVFQVAGLYLYDAAV